MSVSVESVHSKIVAVPSWMIPAFNDGRRTAGLMENIIADLTGAEVLSMNDQRNPDLRLPDGRLVEIKAKSSKSNGSFNLGSSLEIRGNNGKGGRELSNSQWLRSDLYCLCLFGPHDHESIFVKYAFINSGPNNEVIRSVPKKQFLGWF